MGVVYFRSTRIYSLGGDQILAHGGAIPGFSILTSFSPNKNVGVIVLCNADEKAAAARAILMRTYEAVLGLPSSPVQLERYGLVLVLSREFR